MKRIVAALICFAFICLAFAGAEEYYIYRVHDRYFTPFAPEFFGEDDAVYHAWGDRDGDISLDWHLLWYRGGELFRDYDAALLPLACGGAYPKDAADIPALTDEDRRWSAPALISGLPCVALPRGENAAGLPFALQLIADSGKDNTALTAAAALEGGAE